MNRWLFRLRQERSEWEHRVACFFGDCGETPPFGLDDYVIQVPVEGAQAKEFFLGKGQNLWSPGSKIVTQAAATPEAPWAAFPTPGELMFKHENLVFEFTHAVRPDALENVIEFCSNWTSTDVCFMKRVVRLKDMLFVGSKVIINPPQDLDPGYIYNVSIHLGVVSGLRGAYADGSGRFNYSIQVAPEEVDRSPPVLLAIEVVCEADVNGSGTFNDTGHFGCGVWLPAEHISGKPPLWGSGDSCRFPWKP
eukprot:s1173_g16.t1